MTKRELIRALDSEVLDPALERKLDDMRRGVNRPPEGQSFLLALCAGMLGFVVLSWLPRWAAISGGLVVAVLAYLFRPKP